MLHEGSEMRGNHWVETNLAKKNFDECDATQRWNCKQGPCDAKGYASMQQWGQHAQHNCAGKNGPINLNDMWSILDKDKYLVAMYVPRSPPFVRALPRRHSCCLVGISSPC